MFEASVDGQLYDRSTFWATIIVQPVYRLMFQAKQVVHAPAPQPAAQPAPAPVADTGWQEPAAQPAPAPTDRTFCSTSVQRQAHADHFGGRFVPVKG